MTKHGFAQVSDGRSAPQIGLACKLQVGSECESVVIHKAARRRLAPVSETLGAIRS